MKKYRYEIALVYILFVLALVLAAFYFTGSWWVLILSVFALVPVVANG